MLNKKIFLGLSSILFLASACGEDPEKQEGIPGEGIVRYPIVSKNFVRNSINASIGQDQAEVFRVLSANLSEKVNEKLGKDDIEFHCIISVGVPSEASAANMSKLSEAQKTPNTKNIDQSLIMGSKAYKEASITAISYNKQFESISTFNVEAQTTCRAGGELADKIFVSKSVPVGANLKRLSVKEHTEYVGIIKESEIPAKVAEVRKKMESLNLKETAILELLDYSLPVSLFDLSVETVSSEAKVVTNDKRPDTENPEATAALDSEIEADFQTADAKVSSELDGMNFKYQLTDIQLGELEVRDRVINIADKDIWEQMKKDPKIATKVKTAQDNFTPRSTARNSRLR